MYKVPTFAKTDLIVNKSREGESIETKIRRYLNNKEKIESEAPIIFTERKDGVNPAFDIRTDRFEIAVMGMDNITKSRQAQRENVPKKPTEEISGAEPIQTSTES